MRVMFDLRFFRSQFQLLLAPNVVDVEVLLL